MLQGFNANAQVPAGPAMPGQGPAVGPDQAQPQMTGQDAFWRILFDVIASKSKPQNEPIEPETQFEEQEPIFNGLGGLNG